MISRTPKYALNVLRCLARNPGRRMPTKDLARETGVPANYLSKILDQLRKRNVVEGEKGWRGGFRLRPEALELPIQTVVDIFERSSLKTAPEPCIFELGRCDSENPCALHHQWERIRAQRDAMFWTTKVKDLERTQLGVTEP